MEERNSFSFDSNSQFSLSIPSAWIKEHLQITDEINELGVGRVMVEFVVEKDGTISNAKMIRSMHPAIDKEAIRVIESMPKWNPRKINGKPVRVKYMLPVNLK